MLAYDSSNSLAGTSLMTDEKDSGLKITDRRMFNPDGSPRGSGESAETGEQPQREKPLKVVAPDNVVAFPSETSRKPEPAPTPPEVEEKRLEETDGSGHGLPEPTFVGLINMLGVEAAMAMGLIENPVGGGATIDMDAARHMVDMLGMLEEKTKGNLSGREAEILNTILTDLRMQFVTLTQKR